MRKKAILSFDKFAEGNSLSANQLSTIKGGRKKMTKSVLKNGQSDDASDNGNNGNNNGNPLGINFPFGQ